MRQVHDLLVLAVESDVDILDGRVPEPLDVVPASLDQLAPVRDPVLAHERRGARALENLGGRLPDVGVAGDAEDATEAAA